MTGRRTVFSLPILLVGVGVVPLACGDASTAPSEVTANYTVTVLATTHVESADLNDGGQVVSVASQSTLFDEGKITNLGSCTAEGINDAGAIVCSDGSVWNDGAVSRVTFPAAFFPSSSGINDQGISAGTGGIVVVSSPDTIPCSVPISAPGTGARKAAGCAFIEDASGRVTIIEPPKGTTLVDVPFMSHGTDVIVFTLDGTHPPSGAIWRSDSTSTPYVCAGLPVNASLSAVGGDHEVVGYAQLASDSTTDAIVCNAGAMLSLGAQTARANDISRNGTIVGTTDDGRGFVWHNGHLTILDQIASYTSARIVSADRVNNSGQIIATTSDGSGIVSTVLLTPK